MRNHWASCLSRAAKHIFFSGLLETGQVNSSIWVVRDGLVNMYILMAPDGLVCIDAGWRPTRVKKGFDSLQLNTDEVVAVFLTHLHWDHARCMGIYTNADIYVGEQEPTLFSTAFKPSSTSWRRVRDKEKISIKGLTVEVIGTPGHSPGGVSYLVDEKFLFTGDSMRLCQGEARPFFPLFNSDNPAHIHSIRKLAALNSVELLLTGHTGITRSFDFAFARWRSQAS